jgi:hypothetical protein
MGWEPRSAMSSAAQGGGYEWKKKGATVDHGVIALELDQQARISRLTTIWDGSLLDNAASPRCWLPPSGSDDHAKPPPRGSCLTGTGPHQVYLAKGVSGVRPAPHTRSAVPSMCWGRLRGCAGVRSET